MKSFFVVVILRDNHYVYEYSYSSRFVPCSLSISHYLNFFFISSWNQKMIFVVCLFVCLFLYLKKKKKRRKWRCETWESDNGMLRFLQSFPLFLFLSLFEMSLLPNYFLFLSLSFSLYHCFFLSIFFLFVSFQVFGFYFIIFVDLFITHSKN